MKSVFLSIYLAALGASAQDDVSSNSVFVTTTGLISTASDAIIPSGFASSAGSDLVFTTTTNANSVVTTAANGAASSTDSGVPGGFTAFPGQQSFIELLSSEPELSMLNTILRNETFSETLNDLNRFINYTFLAPSNQALGDYLQTDDGQRFQTDPEFARNVLSYHALNGGIPITSDLIPEGGILQSRWTPSLYIFNESDISSSGRGVGAVRSDGDVFFISGFLLNSTVQKADIQFDQGYAHIIDRVLTLPGSLEDTLVAGNFQALLGALEASNIDINDEQALTGGNSSLTLFAPVNQAFLDIGSALQDISAADLTDILKFHVIPLGPLYADDLMDGELIGSLEGGFPTVTIGEDDTGAPAIFIEGAKVVAPNIVTNLGVIHGIDQVLNPNNVTTGIPEDREAGTVQYENAQPVSSLALTEGLPSATSTIALPAAATSVEPYTGAAGTNTPALGMLVAAGLALAVL